jgi:hypothetical protein
LRARYLAQQQDSAMQSVYVSQPPQTQDQHYYPPPTQPAPAATVYPDQPNLQGRGDVAPPKYAHART